MKYQVQATWRRPLADGAYRAGRKWSDEEPVEVDVLDQDDDPPPGPSQGIRLGRKSFEALRRDPRLEVW
jgi:hypothetical protein